MAIDGTTLSNIHSFNTNIKHDLGIQSNQCTMLPMTFSEVKQIPHCHLQTHFSTTQVWSQI